MELKKKEKKEGIVIEKIKRSPDERHTQTHRSLTDTFQQSQISFSIRRQQMYVNTQ